VEDKNRLPPNYLLKATEIRLGSGFDPTGWYGKREGRIGKRKRRKEKVGRGGRRMKQGRGAGGTREKEGEGERRRRTKGKGTEEGKGRSGRARGREKEETREEGQEERGSLKFFRWLSEKLDGVRAFWDGVRLYSKQGHVLHAPKWFSNFLPKNVALDGELWYEGEGNGCVRRRGEDEEDEDEDEDEEDEEDEEGWEDEMCEENEEYEEYEEDVRKVEERG
jgi:hypothetical protein